MSKVSIITPSYNSYYTIERCIQSVKCQKNIDTEHIVLDGASVDQTLEIVKRHESVKFFSEPDSGIYDAINKGLNNSTGDFIAICHSNDYFSREDSIAKIVNKMQIENTSFAYADCIYVNNMLPVRYYKSGKLSSARLSYGLAPAHTTLVIRRSLLDTVGIYSLRYPICGDFEYFTRLLDIPYSYIGEPLVNMTVGGASSFNFRTAMQLNIQLKEILNNKGISTNYLKLNFRYPYKYISSKLNILTNRLSYVSNSRH